MKEILKTFLKNFFHPALKNFLLMFSPILIFSYLSACWLASSFNILSLNENIKTVFIAFLGGMLLFTGLIAILIADK